jgi:hypothetical protein
MKTNDNSLADTLRSIVQDAQGLIRAEIALARAEIREEVARARNGVAMIAAAAVTAVIGLVLLLTAAAWGLSEGLGWPVWAGFAVVTAVVILAAAVLAYLGRKQFTGERHMPRTVDTMKETMQWVAARKS